MGRIPDAVAEFLSGAHDLLVAGRDAELVPSCSIAVGMTVDADRDGVDVYLPVVTSAALLADLAAHPVIAVTCSEVPSHRTVQLKGRVRGIRDARPDERAIVDGYVDAYAGTLAIVGLPPGLTQRMQRWPCRVVSVEVGELFDQTPGPGAGRPLEEPPA